jgi:DNA-binding NtrC family response regulator
VIYAKDVEGEYVLLVEDDLMLLATTQSVLADHGYKVVSCSTPEEGITICSEHPRARVVLTKAAFPGSRLGGIHIAEHAARTCGATTILTGRHDPILLYGLRAFEKFVFVEQPYTSAQIVAAVAEAWSNARRPNDDDPPSLPACVPDRPPPGSQPDRDAGCLSC